MQKKLTPKGIDALPPAKAKRYEVRDTVVPGLRIRVSSPQAFASPRIRAHRE